MKQLIFFPMLFTGIIPAAEPVVKSNPADSVHLPRKQQHQDSNIQDPASENTTRIRSAVFKAQEFCRAELKDFEFDIEYKVVSAVVYFSGTNFKIVEKGFLTSNSLKSIQTQMDKCAPGTTVIFDEVKVIGPDHIIRTIPGKSLILI